MNVKSWLQRKIRKRLGLEQTAHQVTLLLEQQNDLVRRQTDLVRLVQDLLILQRGPVSQDVRLLTDHPIAIHSDDQLFPRGAANDNTRYPRFCIKCEELLGAQLRTLDLGCAGGGIVWDFALRGHRSVGLDGSDFALKRQAGMWRLIPNQLFTCDITEKYSLVHTETSDPVLFDVISAFEVLEHIPEDRLPQFFSNIKRHLAPKGLFIASVATFPDFDSRTGAVWHVTVKPRNWWLAQLATHGLIHAEIGFQTLDFPRGSGNGPYDWSAAANPELGFHIVATHDANNS